MKLLFQFVLLPLLASGVHSYALPKIGYTKINQMSAIDTSHILDGPSLSIRSTTTINACREVTEPLEGRATWLFDEAYCERNGQQGDRRRYTVLCAASNDRSDTVLKHTTCPPMTKCVQRHGVNLFGDDVLDIVCVPNKNVREWIVNAAHNLGTHIACSAGYNVQASPGLNLDVAVNVYDSNAQNRIEAQDVYFEISAKKVPVDGDGAHSIMEGTLFVPNNNALQACVQGRPGQVLTIISGLIGATR